MVTKPVGWDEYIVMYLEMKADGNMHYRAARTIFGYGEAVRYMECINFNNRPYIVELADLISEAEQLSLSRPARLITQLQQENQPKLSDLMEEIHNT